MEGLDSKNVCFYFLKVDVFKKEKLRHGFRLSKKIISLRKILFFYVNVSHFQAMDKNNTLLLEER